MTNNKYNIHVCLSEFNILGANLLLQRETNCKWSANYKYVIVRRRFLSFVYANFRLSDVRITMSLFMCIR